MHTTDAKPNPVLHIHNSTAYSYLAYKSCYLPHLCARAHADPTAS